MVWGYKAHQTLHIQWFGPRWRTKRYVYYGLVTEDAPKVTYTIVWRHMAHQTLRIQWFGGRGHTNRYVYNGLGIQGAPNVTYTMLWAEMAHQTLRIVCFGDRGRTKRYIHISLGTHGALIQPASNPNPCVAQSERQSKQGRHRARLAWVHGKSNMRRLVLTDVA